jgi:hypothetical protein
MRFCCHHLGSLLAFLYVLVSYFCSLDTPFFLYHYRTNSARRWSRLPSLVIWYRSFWADFFIEVLGCCTYLGNDDRWYWQIISSFSCFILEGRYRAIWFHYGLILGVTTSHDLNWQALLSFRWYRHL